MFLKKKFLEPNQLIVFDLNMRYFTFKALYFTISLAEKKNEKFLYLSNFQSTHILITTIFSLFSIENILYLTMRFYL